jgi:hypothetical protein
VCNVALHRFSPQWIIRNVAVNLADNGQIQEQSRTVLLKVVEQAGGKLKFALNAGLMAGESSGDVHTGELTGEVEIGSGEAVFAYDRGKYDQCRIMMKFAPDRIELEQTQECGFGTGVDASGHFPCGSRRALRQGWLANGVGGFDGDFGNVQYIRAGEKQLGDGPRRHRKSKRLRRDPILH